MINSSLHVIIDSFFPIYILPLLLVFIPLIWSLFKAFSLSNIKSIIAFSTINQISYMFLALLLFPLVRLFHIIVHALFKSLLSLPAGSIIHVQSNFQSIYKLRINFSRLIFIFLLLLLHLIVPSIETTLIPLSAFRSGILLSLRPFHFLLSF